MRIAHILFSGSDEEGVWAAKLCKAAEEAGHSSLLCYSSGTVRSDVFSYCIGSKPKIGHRGKIRRYLDRTESILNRETHLFRSRFTDRSGFYSKRATQRLISQLEAYRPDLVHLHRLHGFYLHLPLLFDSLRENNLPVLWSMRDCWAWTGHCAWYTDAEGAPASKGDPPLRRGQPRLGCRCWQGGCTSCVLKKSYPCSYFLDQSRRNWLEKRRLFTAPRNLVIAVPSAWMEEQLRLSFFAKTPVRVLPDPLDTTIYLPPVNWRQADDVLRHYKIALIHQKPLLLAMAPVWDHRAGLDDLVELADLLGEEYQIGVIGLDDFQRTSPLPANMIAIPSPHSERDLAAILTAADLFVQPSHGEASPISLTRALSCGTRVLCYDTAAFSGFVPSGMGAAVPLMDTKALAQAARELLKLPRDLKACHESVHPIGEAEALDSTVQLYEDMLRFANADPLPD